MTIRRLARARVLLCMLGVLAASPAADAFTPNPAGGRLIAPGGQAPVAVADGAGGVIVAWRDSSSGFVLLNRFDSWGAPQWEQGMAFPPGHGVQLVSDGAGGAIVAEQSPGGTRVRRYRHDGASLWQATTGGGTLLADGAGGAWLLRLDGGIVAERVAPDGATPGVVRVSPDLPGLSWPSGVADGLGGLYVAWRRSGALYANRVRADGALAWGSGTTIAANAGAIGAIMLDSSSPLAGVIVAWQRTRVLDVASVAGDGAVRWTAGVPTRGSRAAAVAADADGALVLWNTTDRNGSDDEVAATRFDSRGLRAWTTHLAWTAGEPSALRVRAQRGGGMLAGWQVPGLPFDDSADTDLYLQRLDARGRPHWRDSRLATSLGPDSYGSIVAGFGGSAIAVFAQSPCLMPNATGVAMQRIDAYGNRALTAEGACPSAPPAGQVLAR